MTAIRPLPRRAVELLREWWNNAHVEGAGPDMDQGAKDRADTAYRALMEFVQSAGDGHATYGIKAGQLWMTPDGREVEVRRVCKDDRDLSISKGEMVAKVHHGRISTISCRRLATFKMVRGAP